MEMKKYKLGDILELQRGYDLPHSEMEEGNVPVAGSSGIIGYHSISKIDPPCITIGRSGSVGKLFFYNEAIWPHNTSLYIKNFKNNNEKYIFYLLKTVDFERLCDSSVVPSLNRNFVYPIKVPFYDNVADQQKIAAVLSSLDDKIALNNRINAKLEQMAKRLYDYWFVQFDFPRNVSGEPCLHELSRTDDGNARSDFLGADGKPYKSNGGKMVWNEELKREIPEGWEVKKLGDLFTTNRGVSYSTATITGDGGIPMINLASFSPDGTYKVSGLKLFTGEYTKEKVLKPFDLILCNTQQTAIDFTKDIIGKVLLVPDIFEGDITSSHHVNTLHVSNEDLKFYLYRLCNTDYFHKYISNYASGTNILGLDFSGVENFKAEIPPAALLNQFAKLMLNIEKKKSEVIKENQKLTAMRDKLLPLLMNGQVVVE